MLLNNESLWVFRAFAFALTSILGAAVWYAKKNKVAVKAALLVLWRECVVSGFTDFQVAFIPAMKKMGATLWTFTQQAAEFLAAILRPEPVKHIFTLDLDAALLAAVSGYAYPPFQPVVKVSYSPLPSRVDLSLYTKAAVTDEVKAEIVWAVQAAFREYMVAYSLDFPFRAIPYVQDNRIDVCLYYADRPVELPAYEAQVRRSMLMVAEPAFRPLTETDVPETGELVLGYSLDRWQTTGRIVPIVWDIAATPHIMVSGPTGGGKTVYVKLLLEQLLKAGAAVTVCDFKGHNDLRGLVKDFSAGSECDDALARFCADFEQARKHGGYSQRQVLVFDEFGAFAASKSKKEFDDLMKMISNLVFMGRSYGASAILIAQRFDSETIKTSLREQAGVKVHIGPTISQQSATMLFPNAEIDKSRHLPPCCGYISTPKTDLATFTIPKTDIPALDRRLKMLSEQSTK